jgi:hypothetical protein
MLRRCSGCPGERTELTPAAVRPCNSHPGKLYRSERLYENVVHTLRLTKKEVLSTPDAEYSHSVQTYELVKLISIIVVSSFVHTKLRKPALCTRSSD